MTGKKEPGAGGKGKSIMDRVREEGVTGILRKKQSGQKDPNEMHFLEHLEDLRWVILKSILAFIAGCISVAFFMDESIDVLQKPLVSAVEDFGQIDVDLQSIGMEQYIDTLHSKSVDLGMLRNAKDEELREWGIVDAHHRTRIITHFADGQNRHLLQVIRSYSPIFIAMKICFLGGLGISLPFIFYFIGGFVVPGLTTKEKAVLFPGCVTAFLLFLAGAAMTYFIILPFSLAFTIEFTFDVLGLDTYRPEAGNYYSTVIWMTFAVGIAFQFPLIILLLTWIGVLSVDKLRRNRRLVFVILMISAALITPGGDPVSLSILTIPLYVLYELSIFSGSFIERHKKKKEWEEWDEEMDGPRPPKPDFGKGINKPLLISIIVGMIGLVWVSIENKEAISEWIDKARDFGSFGKDEKKDSSANLRQEETPEKSLNEGNSTDLQVGSILKLEIEPAGTPDANNSSLGGSQEYKVKVLEIKPPEKIE